MHCQFLKSNLYAGKEKNPSAKEKLIEFGNTFWDNQGLPVPVSTLSCIFKEKGRWLNIDIAGGGWNKKQPVRRPTFLHLEKQQGLENSEGYAPWQGTIHGG